MLVQRSRGGLKIPGVQCARKGPQTIGIPVIKRNPSGHSSETRISEPRWDCHFEDYKQTHRAGYSGGAENPGST